MRMRINQPSINHPPWIINHHHHHHLLAVLRHAQTAGPWLALARWGVKVTDGGDGCSSLASPSGGVVGVFVTTQKTLTALAAVSREIQLGSVAMLHSAWCCAVRSLPHLVVCFVCLSGAELPEWMLMSGAVCWVQSLLRWWRSFRALQ